MPNRKRSRESPACEGPPLKGRTPENRPTVGLADYTPVYGPRRRDPEPHVASYETRRKGPDASSECNPRRKTRSLLPRPSCTSAQASSNPVTPTTATKPAMNGEGNGSISPRTAVIPPAIPSSPCSNANQGQRALDKPKVPQKPSTPIPNPSPEVSQASPAKTAPTPTPPITTTAQLPSSLPISSEILPSPPTAGASPGPPRQHRNIEKVMLGNLCFDTWYRSYYSKDILGDHSGGKIKGGKDAHNNQPSPGGSSTDSEPHHCGNNSVKDDGAKVHSRSRDAAPALERLYVCPCCFKYSKELVTWWAHVRYCQARQHVPGEKIYTHPRSASHIPMPQPQSVSSSGRKADQVKKAASEEAEDVKTQGEYSVWEVDGGRDTLFCQNLSLFAKLFLDTKSVFYDVTGFKYYLLVYTAPEGVHVDIRNRIMGFFSKEKLSWDNNNLACILIFPPWQRKGLGNLLMGISYELSRLERVIGGPEKPLSELGQRAYKRYWGGEIARCIENLEPAKNGAFMVLDVDEISNATWIAPEDCLTVLRDMGVTDGGIGAPKPRNKSKKLKLQQDAGGDVAMGEAQASKNFERDEEEAEEEEEEGEEEVRDRREVRRFILDKSQVRRWIAQNGISLSRPCDPDGLVLSYVRRSIEDDKDEEDEEA